MSEGPIPNSWREAIPVVIWVVLVLGFGLLLIDSLGQLFSDPFSRALFALCGLVGLLAMLIHRKWLLERFNSLSGGSVFVAIIVVMIVIALSPYVEQQRWPFKHWLEATPAPSVDEIADAVVRKLPKANMPIPTRVSPPADNDAPFAYALKLVIGFGSSQNENNSAPTRTAQLQIAQVNLIDRPIKAILTKISVDGYVLTPDHTTPIRAKDTAVYQSDVFQISTRPHSGIMEIQIEYGPINGLPVRRYTRRDRIQFPVAIGINQMVTELDNDEEISTH
jgi:hypothetical protein